LLLPGCACQISPFFANKEQKQNEERKTNCLHFKVNTFHITFLLVVLDTRCGCFAQRLLPAPMGMPLRHAAPLVSQPPPASGLWLFMKRLHPLPARSCRHSFSRPHPPSTAFAIITSNCSLSRDTHDAAPSRACIKLANAATFCCCTQEKSSVFALVQLAAAAGSPELAKSSSSTIPSLHGRTRRGAGAGARP
jgi:hypothetical protein